MEVFKLLIHGLQSIIEGVGRSFKPNDDHYPATGVVPYTGEPYQQSS